MHKLPVLSFFKEISLKKAITVGGGVNINGIYYTIFSKSSLFPSLFPSSPPKTTALCKSVLRALCITAQQEVETCCWF